MAVHINDAAALTTLGQLEGGRWMEAQMEDETGRDTYGFLHARRCWLEEANTQMEIYGDGGRARYTLDNTGCVVLLGGTSTPEKEEQARKLGLDVTAYDWEALAKQHAEQTAYQVSRSQSLFALCQALIYEAGAALRMSPEQITHQVTQEELDMFYVQASNRILGWANKRLGVVSSELMEEQARICNQRFRADGVVGIAGDLPRPGKS
jgi:hypothetical protein